jgi:ribosome-associated protein
LTPSKAEPKRPPAEETAPGNDVPSASRKAIPARLDSREKALLCSQLALEHKALDLMILEVTKLSSYTDYFVILSGNSDRQVQAIASDLEEKLGQRGYRPLGIEGKREGRWVLLDYGDVLIHIFYQPIREFYDLERLWGDAPKIALPAAKKTRKSQP